MAIVRCKRCGNDVSTKEKVCPACGASLRKVPWGIICAGGFLGLIALAVFGGNRSTLPTRPTQAASLPVGVDCSVFSDIGPPHATATRFEVKIKAAARGEARYPTVIGKTDLPVGTNLLITLERSKSAYKAQAEAAVDEQGCFKGGPFTQNGAPINTGSYTIDVLMPVAQPDSVSEVIGEKGQRIYGSLVRRFQHFGKIAEFRTPYSVGEADTGADAVAKRNADVNFKAWQGQSRSTLVVHLARHLKAHLRHPSSADWVSVLANDDATVVCIVLRARNDLGGTSIGQYAFVNGTGSTNAATWSQHCAGKSLTDLTSTVRGAV